MGQKINPISLRLQKTNRRYDSSWYSNYHYGELFLFDLKVRDYLERILKQLKYPEGRALISHFSKGSKINLFAFNPTSSRQQKLGAFGLKGAVRVASHMLKHKQERQRKLSPVLAKSFEHRNELLSTTFSIKKRPLKALSSKSKALSIDQEVLLVNQNTCSEKKNSVLLGTNFKQNTNKTGNKWNPFLPYLACCATCEVSYEARKKFSIFDEKTHGDLLPLDAKGGVELNDLGRKTFFSVNDSLFLKPCLSTQQAHNTRVQSVAESFEHKQVFNALSKAVPSDSTCFARHASVPSDWQHNGSHLVPFFALKDTLNPSYLFKVKRLRDSCFALHASASLTLNICVQSLKQVQSNEELKVKLKQRTLAGKSEHVFVRSEQLVQAENTCFARNTLSIPASEARNKCEAKQVVSKTLSLWYQRAQGSTHPILVSLGADKKTIPLRDKIKETSCKAVAKSNPTTSNKLLVPQPQQSFSKENSLYRCHVESVLDQQTGSSVKLVPFQVSTEKQSALFLAQEVVYFLEKRVSFRKIKDQILKELKNSKIIKGVRITCSGRVGGKSKKAQKAKTETVKQGQTSLGVFSSKIDFAQKSALTSFGLIGVKVWICFY